MSALVQYVLSLSSFRADRLFFISIAVFTVLKCNTSLKSLSEYLGVYIASEKHASGKKYRWPVGRCLWLRSK